MNDDSKARCYVSDVWGVENEEKRTENGALGYTEENIVDPGGAGF